MDPVLCQCCDKKRKLVNEDTVYSDVKTGVADQITA